MTTSCPNRENKFALDKTQHVCPNSIIKYMGYNNISEEKQDTTATTKFSSIHLLLVREILNFLESTFYILFVDI